MRRRVPFVLLAVFLVLFVLGVTLGEPESVLEKAVAICLSCIGVG
jgi:hypothetical protein